MKDIKGLQILISLFIIIFCGIDIFVKSITFEEEFILKVIFLTLDLVFLIGGSIFIVSSKYKKEILLFLIIINFLLILYNFFINVYLIYWFANTGKGSMAIIEGITNIINLPLLFIFILSIFSYRELKYVKE